MLWFSTETLGGRGPKIQITSNSYRIGLSKNNNVFQLKNVRMYSTYSFQKIIDPKRRRMIDGRYFIL